MLLVASMKTQQEHSQPKPDLSGEEESMLHSPAHPEATLAPLPTQEAVPIHSAAQETALTCPPTQLPPVPKEHLPESEQTSILTSSNRLSSPETVSSEREKQISSHVRNNETIPSATRSELSPAPSVGRDKERRQETTSDPPSKHSVVFPHPANSPYSHAPYKVESLPIMEPQAWEMVGAHRESKPQEHAQCNPLPPLQEALPLPPMSPARVSPPRVSDTVHFSLQTRPQPVTEQEKLNIPCAEPKKVSEPVLNHIPVTTSCFGAESKPPCTGVGVAVTVTTSANRGPRLAAKFPVQTRPNTRIGNIAGSNHHLGKVSEGSDALFPQLYPAPIPPNRDMATAVGREDKGEIDPTRIVPEQTTLYSAGLSEACPGTGKGPQLYGPGQQQLQSVRGGMHSCDSPLPTPTTGTWSRVSDCSQSQPREHTQKHDNSSVPGGLLPPSPPRSVRVSANSDTLELTMGSAPSSVQSPADATLQQAMESASSTIRTPASSNTLASQLLSQLQADLNS